MSKPVLILGIICLVQLSIIVYLLLPEKQLRSKNTIAQQTIEIPQTLIVPDAFSTPSPDGIAIPRSVESPVQGSPSKVRTFIINANANAFSSNKIAVNQNDVVHIEVNAVDQVYDFTIDKLGLSQTVAQGQTRVIEFQATTPGSYLYSCKSCAGGKTKFEGNVVIPQGVLLVVGQTT